MRQQLLVVCLALGTLSLLATGSAPGQGPVPPSPYYPLQVGNTWHYQAGSQKMVVKVAAHEKVGEVLCARVEATQEGSKSVEFISMQTDGLFRYKTKDKEIKPPLCFFKLPPQKGADWAVDSEIDGAKIKGKFTTDEEEVMVPAGKYKTFKVTSKDFTIGSRALSLTYWFAKDVGVVKYRLEVAGVEVVLELEKFVPGK
jgi:hypothetical protein